MYDMRAFFRGGKAHSPRRSFICTKSCEQATNTSTSCLKHPFPIKVIGTRSHATHQYQVPARALSRRWLPHLACLAIVAEPARNFMAICLPIRGEKHFVGTNIARRAMDCAPRQVYIWECCPDKSSVCSDELMFREKQIPHGFHT